MITSSQWTVTEEYKGSPAGKAFSSLDKVFSVTGHKITDDKLSDVIRVEVGNTHYYVKRYTSAGKGLRRYLGRSRIRAEWENMLFFHRLGIPAAKVVAYGEEKSWGMMTRGSLITEEVKNTNDLSQMASGQSALLKDRHWMNQVIRQIASVAKKLHQNHFIHTDFKWRNILVTQDEKPRISLIDCPAGEFVIFPFLERGIIKDLACLDKLSKYHLSRTQRMKFYTLYTGKKLCASDKKRIRKILRFFEGRE